MKLSEKAEEPPDVTLVDDILESYYQILEDDPSLVPADDLTPEGDFPQFGDFLEVKEKSPVDGTFRGNTWLLVTQDLAQFLVESEIGTDDWFVIRDKQKVEGTWEFDAEVVDEE